MKKIIFILALLFSPSLYAATLTPNTVPYVCQGGSSPQLCDSSVTTDSTGDIYSNSGGWQDYSGGSTIVGFSSILTKVIYYKKIGKTVFVTMYITGTSNSTSFTFTVPYTNAAYSNPQGYNAMVQVRDNSVTQTTPGVVLLPQNSSTVTVFKDCAQNPFTASGNKFVSGQFWYQSQ